MADFDRFWSKVNKGGESECWPWTAYCNRYGYGQFWFNGRKQNASRVVMMLSGVDVEGKEVCHHCDNPKCCNPNHLFVGTHEENVKDAKEKDRIRSGEEHGRAKLSDELVKQIRHDYSNTELTQRELAEKYNTSASNIHSIVNHKTRKDIDE
jgi:ribosome-binding protein aMBF1 (putative translation factor)